MGSSRTDVEAQRGRPGRRDGGTYVYALTEEVPNEFHVAFGGDRVSSLTWPFYVD